MYVVVFITCTMPTTLVSCLFVQWLDQIPKFSDNKWLINLSCEDNPRPIQSITNTFACSVYWLSSYSSNFWPVDCIKRTTKTCYLHVEKWLHSTLLSILTLQLDLKFCLGQWYVDYSFIEIKHLTKLTFGEVMSFSLV